MEWKNKYQGFNKGFTLEELKKPRLKAPNNGGKYRVFRGQKAN